MKQADNAVPEVGCAGSVTFPDSSTALNVEEYAPAPTNQTRTGFPKQGGQSLSYWLQQVRSDPLLDHRTTEDLPQDADTVIIGSGITGSLAAKEHLSVRPHESIVILEAREFCSGATGRNAGHCKPDQWRGFGKFEKAYGKEQAIKILDNEAETWNALVDYVREHNVDCDLWVGDTLDVPVEDEVARLAKEVFERYREAGGRVEHIKVTHDHADAVRVSRIKDAKACYAWQASTLQPWKLTAHIMRDNLEKGANLQTYTVATSVTKATKGRRRWIVQTSRGEIACDNVIHATNAYSAALEPILKGIITPKPHICTKVVPPRAVSGTRAIRNSYGVLLPDGGLFSINPRCTADGNVMFGGSNPGQKALDDWVEKHPENCINDGLADVEGVTSCVKSFIDDNFEGWNHAEYGPGEGIQYSWSGIIGLSVDGVPFVGELPGKPGQWICAGHHGHGMARIFTAAPGLVKLMSGKSWDEVGLPDVYQITASRLERLQKASVSKVAII
ncbi:FAD dependent oxidoreductase [Stagonosporopsis vannaccii]|nr:FAD dependent oxidoreductase [Stagonosporopsis vannaccii]